MRVNADFSRAVVVTPDEYRWVASPQPGVERVMLDRVGEEQARATSIVRYAPGSRFPRHTHPGGEEILVLSGTFSEGDEHSPAGSYLRNPPGSAHAPRSDEGAVLFVKLRQMAPDEEHRLRIDTRPWQQRPERAVLPLFSAPSEQVVLQRLNPGEAPLPARVDGAELLVLAGALHFEGTTCPPGSWLRLPVGAHPTLTAGEHGATVYRKTGHLLDLPRAAG